MSNQRNIFPTITVDLKYVYININSVASFSPHAYAAVYRCTLFF